ncbi:hypothetical protein [Alkaliphilus sp. B6464]|uniref:hypothetical protein n=1 Tax=Alkaliphilus sp. B6464 TaxID=2731219 RepID=UPI001BADEFBC|nr:hypothetical protein [Alkaliphilus sp. B6464]QUH21974.1 hypothetical protein HYG84_18895 [Alkaliphilus sp. B6464]
MKKVINMKAYIAILIIIFMLWAALFTNSNRTLVSNTSRIHDDAMMIEDEQYKNLLKERIRLLESKKPINMSIITLKECGIRESEFFLDNMELELQIGKTKDKRILIIIFEKDNKVIIWIDDIFKKYFNGLKIKYLENEIKKGINEEILEEKIYHVVNKTYQYLTDYNLVSVFTYRVTSFFNDIFIKYGAPIKRKTVPKNYIHFNKLKEIERAIK